MISKITVILSLACLTVDALAEDLVIDVLRHSMHVGETLKCTIRVDKADLRSGQHPARLVSQHLPSEYTWPRRSEEETSFYFSPSKPGMQELGPVELFIAGKISRATATTIHVLEQRDENFFEIRVFDDMIATNQFVEVVVQASKHSERPNPYVPVSNGGIQRASAPVKADILERQRRSNVFWDGVLEHN